jgi:hypothetical protein
MKKLSQFFLLFKKKNIKKWTVVFLILFSHVPGKAQKNDLTYYENIEPIISKSCTSCHRPNQAAPFSLLTYEDVKKRGKFIVEVTQRSYMPPWKADPTFQSYKNERILTDGEKQTIKQWVENGMKKGKPHKSKSIEGHVSNVDTPDLTLTMKEPYTITTDGKDDYRFFNIPTNLDEDKFVAKIEFIAGNKRLVHHSRLMTDTTHKVRSINGLSATDPRIAEFEKYPPLDKFLYGWVPGNFPITFPTHTGKRILKGTDIILNLHFAPNFRTDQVDQSVINFYFAKEKVDREVYSLAIAEENISNPPFIVKANDKPTFYASFGPIPIDISVIAVLPHMHYLGKTFKAFAITPDGNAIHLIKIDNWDFKWQDTYQFKSLLHLPKGSILLIEASYDNTAENRSNPTNPPKDVTYGWNTDSEMMELVVYYIEYKEGD